MFFANQLRAHLHVSPTMDAPVAPPRLAPKAIMPNPPLPPIAVPPVADPNVVPLMPPPATSSDEIDQHPELQSFRRFFLGELPLSKRNIVELNKKTY